MRVYFSELFPDYSKQVISFFRRAVFALAWHWNEAIDVNLADASPLAFPAARHSRLVTGIVGIGSFRIQ